MIAAGRRSKWRSISALDLVVVDPAGAERLDRERDRPGDADAVRDLDLEAVGEAGGDDVLGDPAGGVRRRAVDLRRILAGEGSATVAGHPAVAVDDDLAAGQPGIAHRAAGHEASGRVDVHDRVGVAQLDRDRRQDHGLDDVVVGAARPGRRGRAGPRRPPSGPARGIAVLVLDRDLGLAVRPEVGQLAGLADLGQATRHPVGERDRERHQLRGLAAGEPEHHPLVARAELVDASPCRRGPRARR